MEFDANRTGTGTAEWSEHTENICRGCPNNCLYCYAAHNANRFKQRTRSEWDREELTKKALIPSYPKRKGVVMFPSAHDITPFNLDAYIRVARLILQSGNQLLIVSKPRIDCISTLITALSGFKDQILFRLTIGTMSAKTSKFWEPGAPEPLERLSSLRLAYLSGYKTSVSMEPLLGGLADARAVLSEVCPYVTETIWIGKMNKIRRRVDMSDPVTVAAVEEIEKAQSDDNILKMYQELQGNPAIRWKDSIKEVVTSIS